MIATIGRIRSIARWSRLTFALAIAILLGMTVHGTPRASANHRVAGGWHQTRMHSADANSKEATCVQAGSDSHISHAEFRANVRTKMYIDNPAEDWDELANSKIYLDLPLVNGLAKPCSEFPNRASIPIELYMSHNTRVKDANWWYANPCDPTPTGQDQACTKNDIDVFNGVANHWDKSDGFIFFPERTLYTNTGVAGSHPRHNDSQRAYVISHEFGHIFGLNDGFSYDCAISIMHAGKGTCGITIFWPQAGDRTSVTDIANNG